MPNMTARRVDANQKAIVVALREIGCSVQHLHETGAGCPDLLVGISGINILIECKDGTKPPSARKLTHVQSAWHEAWRGQSIIAYSPQEAVSTVQRLRKQHLDQYDC